MKKNFKNIAVFLDRDGTINEDLGYYYKIEDVNLYDFSGEAIKRLNSSGILTVIFTNQSGVARGYFSEEFVNKVNRKLQKLLEEKGAQLDGIYYCPHLKEGSIAQYTRDCDCRKPKTGMLLKAAEELHIDLEKSFVVGDKVTDLLPGMELKMTTICVMTGYGKEAYNEFLQQRNTKPDYFAENLSEAVEIILREKNKK